MRNAALPIVALLALAFNLFALYDLWAVLSGVGALWFIYPPEYLEMVRAYPEWRIVTWAAALFLGIIGSGLLLLRRMMAERALWTTALLFVLLVVADTVLLGGARFFGPYGIVMSGVIVGIEALFALYARRAARHGLLR